MPPSKTHIVLETKDQDQEDDLLTPPETNVLLTSEEPED